MNQLPGQLALDLEPRRLPARVEDDLSDLDFDRARRIFAEEETAAMPRTCRCASRSMYTITEYGELVCLKCGRRW